MPTVIYSFQFGKLVISFLMFIILDLFVEMSLAFLDVIVNYSMIPFT